MNYTKSGSWAGIGGEIGSYIDEECGRTLQSYRAQPNLVLEHANHEQDTARGGYADRQIFELVQNGADALSNSKGGNIEIRLTQTHLYCADSGQGIDTEGVKALMFSYLSPKRGTDEIGRFGLGFKSVLGVSDSPEFFSRSGSFKFDRVTSRGMIQRQVPNIDIERFPVLRLAMPLDAQSAADDDSILRDLMKRANNIVRLPLLDGAYTKLSKQTNAFPAQFLLFVRHVARLDIRNDVTAKRRIFELDEDQDIYYLSDNRGTTQWRVFHRMHTLSADAKADSRTLDDAVEVPIWWATPLEGDNPAGHFWAFFPTSTPSLVPGILNAPWKTNEDRQNLLTGVYNDELVTAAAELIADNLHHLSTQEDPARHLDALPRRVRQVDRGHTVKLSDELFTKLYGRPLIPDTSGTLRRFDDINFPPEIVMRRRRGYDANLDTALEHWYGCSPLPERWLHQSATNVRRWPFIGRLGDPKGTLVTDGGKGVSPTQLHEWLEAIVETASPDQAIEASKTAIRISEIIPESRYSPHDFGSIVLTRNGDFASINDDLCFPMGDLALPRHVPVHDGLVNDPLIRQALQQLGVKKTSLETLFEFALDEVFAGASSPDYSSEKNWNIIWQVARKIPMFAANKIKKSQSWQDRLRVKTVGEKWVPVHSALLPGRIVPADGTRDDNIAIHPEFHERYNTILRHLGITDRPHHQWDLSAEREFNRWKQRCRNKFIHNTSSYANSRPRYDMLNFTTSVGFGPTTLLELLSDEGRAIYTDVALNEPELFHLWKMRHDTRSDYYRSLDVVQPAIEAIRKHGRIQTSVGIVPFADALGETPKNREAQRFLHEHPNTDKIKEAFDLHDVPAIQHVYAVNATPPVRITEAWPGLSQHINREHRSCNLIHCEAIHDQYGDDIEQHHAKSGDDIFVVHMDREDELDAIADELDILLDDAERFGILNQPTPEEIREARRAVRAQPDEESKLLKAVGEDVLQDGLPDALTAYYSRNGRQFTGIEIARAAISTYHTGALKQYKHALSHLDPPKQWAGSSQAIQFVTELGFGPEWAGERSSRRDPFLEVPGPIELPPLHDYQTIAANKLRQMLRSSNTVISDHRAMISLPTGAGKTRVAVEGAVIAIAEDGFEGGILWVADRDELCEQAVQAWQEVWRAKGRRDQILRISRMWEGQSPPLATNENHVVVASVQTLSSKLGRANPDYDFLRDFKLIIFDEAHRTVAPTFTSVMDELGFRTRQGNNEPLLLGLTATPYRGYSESETRWLVNRYGNNRLDHGAFWSDDPEMVMRELQAQRILARADHVEIEGSSFTLYGNEIEQVATTPWLPNSVENRITRDAERTTRIVQAYKEHIGSQTELWPTLVFATSVEHAQTLAAILNDDGISARAVSGTTDRYTRRQVVEQFRAGDLKVLVNYGVFREGFDAPKTRAIIVARPVYSPNLYFQMIGRGLRGIANGGNDRCLILDVNDNILNFDRKLAFTELDWLWD